MAKSVDDKLCKDFGLKVKNQREKSGFSIRQLARLSGVSHVTIISVERNIYRPSFLTVAKLSKALKIDVKGLKWESA